MKKPLVNANRLLLLVCLLLLISSLMPARIAAPVAQIPRGLLHDLMITPVASTARWLFGSPPPELQLEYDPEEIVRLLEEIGQDLAYLRNLEQENARLRQEIQLYEQIVAIAEDRMPPRPLPASTVYYTRDRLRPMLTIDKGRTHGVQHRQVVVHGHHIVGFVEQTSARSADIRPIVTPAMQLQVRIVPPAMAQPPRELNAWVQVADDGETFITRQSIDRQVQVGDLAHLDDPRFSSFAQGFVVGQVVDVRPDPEAPLIQQQITIRPRIDIRNIRRVQVLLPPEEQ